MMEKRIYALMPYDQVSLGMPHVKRFIVDEYFGRFVYYGLVNKHPIYNVDMMFTVEDNVIDAPTAKEIDRMIAKYPKYSVVEVGIYYL